MQIFDQTLDPSETKDFTFDWSPRLGSGETVSSQVVSFVNAAGTTSPSNSVASPVSRVWLTGGNPGERVIFTIAATTSAGRTLEEAFGVDVVDTVLGPSAETEIERLTREIAECKAQRVKVATGNAVVEVWRDGRKLRKHISTLAELNDLILVLEGELSAAQTAAGIVNVAPRRSAIGTYY